MKISFIKNKELETENLVKIINLKNQYWNYSFEQHKIWIENNLEDDDCHLLLFDDEEKLIAYLNFVQLLIISENLEEKKGIGIGNVCVAKVHEKKGLGLLLMHIANYYIKNNQKQGVLLCKESLVDFYKKAGWSLFKGNYFVKQEKVSGLLMLLIPMSMKKIKINKIF